MMTMCLCFYFFFFFFSSRRRHTRLQGDWSSDVCSSDLTGPTDVTLQVFRVIRAIQDEIGVAAASTYIVSRTRSADDLLRVLLLAREGGLVDLSREPALSRIDIVPLFETLEDLEQAPLVVRSLLGDPIWQRHL